MKKLLAATFVALLMAGCGEGSKKPTEDSPESNQSPAAPPIVVNWNQLQDRENLLGKSFPAYQIDNKN